ncbi:MAG: hypothetical protein ACE5D0_03500 [Fidelibacterota bacterium]
MGNTIIKGVLSEKDGKSFILGRDGEKHFENHLIWDGYLTHWLNKEVSARMLPQTDYETKKPIIIMWPDIQRISEPIVEFYYNERLVKYLISFFGHNAISINNDIYNFSHMINENEIMTQEEYFYRPALGEFAPSPNNGKFEILEDGKAYYDKFGRNFMRTIHVLRIKGMDTDKLSTIYNEELDAIHHAPVNPKKPEKYAEFNFLDRSCSTIIRDGLIKYGFKNLKGILPRDLFVNLIYNINNQKSKMNVKMELYTMPQLKVPESPESTMTPILNWKNRKRYNELKKLGLV